jgi:hypothetical protein
MGVTRRSADTATGIASKGDSQSMFQVSACTHMSQYFFALLRYMIAFSYGGQEEATRQRRQFVEDIVVRHFLRSGNSDKARPAGAELATVAVGFVLRQQ